MSDSAKEKDVRERMDASTVQLVIKETKDLIRSLEGTTTRRVKVRAAGLDIEVERQEATVVAAGPAALGATPAVAAAVAAAAPGRMPIVAPLVGVFYRAASPGAKPFVEVGDTVERGQKVGIVEAMKMMNEVTSDYRGVVAEILVGNGDTVQYEQTLMLIDVTGAGK
jgi:acetyl-CoA carboxylase biotin carboxyl carrier protein